MNKYDKQLTEGTTPANPAIMIVDCKEDTLKVLRNSLEGKGYKVSTFLDAQNAINKLKKGIYDLIITELELPNFSGIEFVKKSKKISPNSDLVVMTEFPSVETAVESMKLGATDYIAKPLDMEYFNIIVEKTLYKRILEKRAAEREYYEQISRVDGLTGLYNHRFFHNLLDSEIARANRYKRNFSLLMIDIDDFKKFNDKYGHQTGDNILKKMASIFVSLARKTDPVIRYGGEEFAIILSETDKEHGYLFGNRVVNSVASSKFKGIQGNTLTISAGLAGYPDDAHTHESLIKKSDEALYQAKRVGKNTLYVYGNTTTVKD
ncbi:MAG: diguanylate cyclase [Candidatus Scalinduaceae bacterium]